MVETKTVNARARQNPLRERYQETPEEALITDRARTTGGVETDPWNRSIIPGSQETGGIISCLIETMTRLW